VLNNFLKVKNGETMYWETKLIVHLKEGKVSLTIRFEDEGLASGNK